MRKEQAFPADKDTRSQFGGAFKSCSGRNEVSLKQYLKQYLKALIESTVKAELEAHLGALPYHTAPSEMCACPELAAAPLSQEYLSATSEEARTWMNSSAHSL